MIDLYAPLVFTEVVHRHSDWNLSVVVYPGGTVGKHHVTFTLCYLPTDLCVPGRHYGVSAYKAFPSILYRVAALAATASGMVTDPHLEGQRVVIVIRGSRSSRRGRCSGGLSGLRGLLSSRGSRAHLPVDLHNRLTVDILGGAADPTLHLHTQSVAGLKLGSLKVFTEKSV